jgi:hypothetical protein
MGSHRDQVSTKPTPTTLRRHLIQATAEEFERWRAEAKRRGLSFSALVRAVLNAQIR